MKIIGLDVGERRIGISRADSATRIALPVGYIAVDGMEWEKIRNLAQRFDTVFFVVGLPRSNDGNETAQSQYVRNFAQNLTKEIPEAKIQFQDESLTSVVAEERLKARKKNYEKGEIDAEAATIILQDFLERFNTNTLSGENDAKKKSRNWIRIVSIVMVFVIFGLLATGGVLWYREKVRADRQEEYRRQEAEMVAEVFDFTILPGETVRDVRGRLIEAGYQDAEVDEALNPRGYDYGFLNGVDSLEGYLYGETIEFYKTATAKEVIGKFLSEMARIIEENSLEEKYTSRGLSLHEGIILASVIQKEAKTEDMPTVAQVFLTRLSYGMAIGSDVTVTYALDLIDPERSIYRDNQSALQIDSCYNTRLYAGLPCGAISNPGLSALLAVANPTDTAYLYFLTGDDGLMYYSYTEAEHIQNIYSHCQELCNVLL